MKREHFLKTIAGLAGGLTVVSCSNDLISDLVDSPEPSADLSITEAKKWFNEVYMQTSDFSARESSGEKTHKRKAAWDRAQKPKNNDNKSFVWVPMDYDDDTRPAVLFYDNETLYKKELARFFMQPVLEGLVVVNKSGKTSAFLAQIAYDPIYMAANNFKLEKLNFTGTLLKVDWDDNLINGITYEKGKAIDFFKSDNGLSDDKNAKIKDCVVNWVSSTASYGTNSNGEFVTILHKNYVTVCDSSGSGNFGFGGGSYGTDGSGGNGGGETPYDPLVNSGAGNIQNTYTQLYNFVPANAVKNIGSDRVVVNNNLKKGLEITKLIVDIHLWSLENAKVLGKTIGVDIEKAVPLIYEA